MFDAGVEQAKRDFRKALLEELRVPHHTVGTDNADLPEAVKEGERQGFFARWRK